MVSDLAGGDLRGMRSREPGRRTVLQRVRGAARCGALAGRTGYLVIHGDALVALAEVLLAAGKDKQGVSALNAAAELFERKEAAVQAAQTREQLRALGL
jgi:hypothetical protein